MPINFELIQPYLNKRYLMEGPSLNSYLNYNEVKDNPDLLEQYTEAVLRDVDPDLHRNDNSRNWHALYKNLKRFFQAELLHPYLIKPYMINGELYTYRDVENNPALAKKLRSKISIEIHPDKHPIEEHTRWKELTQALIDFFAPLTQESNTLENLENLAKSATTRAIVLSHPFYYFKAMFQFHYALLTDKAFEELKIKFNLSDAESSLLKLHYSKLFDNLLTCIFNYAENNPSFRKLYVAEGHSKTKSELLSLVSQEERGRLTELLDDLNTIEPHNFDAVTLVSSHIFTEIIQSKHFESRLALAYENLIHLELRKPEVSYLSKQYIAEMISLILKGLPGFVFSAYNSLLLINCFSFLIFNLTSLPLIGAAINFLTALFGHYHLNYGLNFLIGAQLVSLLSDKLDPLTAFVENNIVSPYVNGVDKLVEFIFGDVVEKKPEVHFCRFFKSPEPNRPEEPAEQNELAMPLLALTHS